MSDYLQVPKASNNNNESYYYFGSTVFSREGIGNWKIAYTASGQYNVRVGVYRADGNWNFVVVSDSSISPSDIDIRIVSPTFVSSLVITSITNPCGSGLGGYFNVGTYTADGMTSNLHVFTSLSDVLNAIAFSPSPVPGSGVVVTVNASPNYTPPSTNGVIVTVIGRLLDPNDQGGTSITGGGQGTFDDTSDPIPIPPMPDISAANSGLVTLFRPTQSQLDSLSSYLWTNITDFIENLNKLFANPMDYLISLNILPCVPDVGAERVIKIGSFTTTINMPPILSQWYEFNCGEISIPEYWGSYLDYAPYTKISLFLPFIGTVQLNTDEVMGNRLGVKYRIDLLSGQCVAMVTVSGLNVQTSVLYQYTGECAVSIPMTGSDWARIYSAAIGAVGTAITGGIAAGASGAAAGGATAALAGAQAADAASNAGLAYAMINDTSKGIPGVQQMRADMARASQMALQAGQQAASAPVRVANGVRATRIANTVNNTIGSVISSKYAVNHTGTITASAGMLGVKVPYVLLEFPNQSLADNYKHFVGYPSNMYARLGDLHGYTECEKVIASGLINQTDEEIAQILEALKGGVYL